DDAVHTLAAPHRQVSVYPVRDGRVATLFVHETRSPGAAATSEDAGLRDVYGGLGWIVPRLLEASPPHAYHDDVTQVTMPRWSRGRIVLVGDAAYCVSLLAGQGAALAMAGACVLADELAAIGDVPEALRAYEQRLAPLVAKKQRDARR